jgi:GDP-L-fucose synthase
MYPRNRSEALREDWVLQGPLEPTNEGYALAKIAIARLGEYLTREHPEFHCKTLIPCNLYGRHDKFDPRSSHLVPAIIQKIHQAKQTGQDEVEIWGDGTARREFMYAGDLADAIVQALSRFDDLPVTMNIGLGCDHTVNEYYAAAADVIGWRGRFVHNLSKPVGMARKLVDIGRQTTWGWHARHDLHTGLERTYAFYLSQQP